jgi:two-component system response regulator NreC
MDPAPRRPVLLADDLEPVLSAVADLLHGSFDVMVSDGLNAPDSILALEPHLAVLDISVPGMSGLEVAKELKLRGSKTKIVFLTVQEDSQIIAACLSAGALGYVVKELMDSDLILAMNKALAGRVFVSRLLVKQSRKKLETKLSSNFQSTSREKLEFHIF